MRTVGFLALTLFLPLFAYADGPPTLTSYTISNSTIYPSASAASGLASTTAIDIAFSEAVKASIKILSSSGALIKSLYTSPSVTNPTAKIWDGTNTAQSTVTDGVYTVLISATSTASGLPMSDSSKTITIAPSGSSVSSDSSSDATTESVSAPPSEGPPEYLPIPTLRIITSGARTVSSGAETAFTASVYDGKGNRRDDAVVSWSFGDGMRKVGASVFHQYYHPGEYLAIVHAATTDGGSETSEMMMTVQDASIKISSVSSRGIALINNDSRTLDLSLWRLSMGGQQFKIPDDTRILAGRTILFPSQVIELPPADTAYLLYPSGEIAAAYPPVLAVQPSSRPISYQQVQAVEPAVRTSVSGTAHENTAVGAPAATTELAAAGAALPASSSASTSRALEVLKSPWTLSFLGVVALAAGAFILL